MDKKTILLEQPWLRRSTVERLRSPCSVADAVSGVLQEEAWRDIKIFLPPASRVSALWLGHVQKSKFGEKVTYVFRLFDFWNFFLPFLFLLFSCFCCSDWPSTGLACGEKTSEKTSSRRVIFSMQHPGIVAGNFAPTFLLNFLTFLCISKAPLGRSLWSGHHWKDLFLLQKLSIDDANFGQKWWQQKRKAKVCHGQLWAAQASRVNLAFLPIDLKPTYLRRNLCLFFACWMREHSLRCRDVCFSSVTVGYWANPCLMRRSTVDKPRLAYVWFCCHLLRFVTVFTRLKTSLQ